MTASERVLCFERKLLDDLGPLQGLSLDVERYLPILDSDQLVYLPRDQAEQDPRYKQLIPYIIVLVGGRLLRYRRSKSGGEKRLHDLYSIGVGGHICDQDAGQQNGYWEGMRRELVEEIGLGDFKAIVAAVINDDRNSVGQVHFGVVHILPTRKADSLRFCPDIANPEFVNYQDATADLTLYENWSRLCLEAGADLPANAIARL